MGADRFRFEKVLVQEGKLLIAGVDEAGRGPLAGPVVAAAVIFPTDWIQNGLPKQFRGLNDSKQLSTEQREHYFQAITTSNEVRWACSVVDAGIIDSINILQATHRAMNHALAQLIPSPEYVLVDGLKVASLKFAQTPIVQGDAKSYSIAAASVIAKVTRDRLMLAYDQQFPMYGFGEHKGYGTQRHLAALEQHGPCPIHRMSFAPLKPVPEQQLLDL